MSHSLSAAQLRWIHKARALADSILVGEKKELFETLYRDTENPKTHVQLARILLSDHDLWNDEKFHKNIITFAAQKAFDPAEYKELQKKRREKFNLTHADRVGQEKIDEIMQDARATIMTDFTRADRRKWRQTWWKNRGFSPRDNQQEIDYLDMLMANPWYHLRNDTDSYLDCVKIAWALNAKFHKGKAVRDSTKISSFLQKRKDREQEETNLLKQEE